MQHSSAGYEILTPNPSRTGSWRCLRCGAATHSASVAYLQLHAQSHAPVCGRRGKR